MRMSMYFMILLSVFVFYFHSFVNMCACHVYFKINLLTKLTYYVSSARRYCKWQYAATILSV